MYYPQNYYYRGVSFDPQFSTMIIMLLMIFVIMYIWKSFELYKALKAIHYKRPFLAWIPFADDFALADAVKSNGEFTEVFGLMISSKIFPWLWLIPLAVKFEYEWIKAFLLGFYLSICYMKLFAKLEKRARYDDRDNVIIGLLSGFINPISTIKLTFFDPQKYEELETLEARMKEEEEKKAIMEAEADKAEDKKIIAKKEKIEETKPAKKKTAAKPAEKKPAEKKTAAKTVKKKAAEKSAKKA